MTNMNYFLQILRGISLAFLVFTCSILFISTVIFFVDYGKKLTRFEKAASFAIMAIGLASLPLDLSNRVSNVTEVSAYISFVPVMILLIIILKKME